MGRITALKRRKSPLIRVDDNIIFLERRAKSRQVGETLTMDNETVERIADAHPARLRIVDYRDALCEIAVPVEIGMANPRACFDYRYTCIVAYEAYQPCASPRDDYIHNSDRIEKCRHRLAGRRKKGACRRIHAVSLQYGRDDSDYAAVRMLSLRAALENADVPAL